MTNNDFFDSSKDILSDLAKEGYSGDKVQSARSLKQGNGSSD